MFKLRRQVTFKKDRNVLKYYIARMGAIKKNKKTIYIDDVAYLMDKETGEILRPKKWTEVKASIMASARRAETISREIVDANTWDYMVTFTFSDKWVDRHNDKKVEKLFRKWRKYVRSKIPTLYYWGAPERHEDGAIHFHFLFGGATAEELGLIDSGRIHKNGQKIYNSCIWKYGFSTFVKITGEESAGKVCNYVMKYIQKSIAETERGRKRYWYSKETCAKPRIETSDVVIDILQKRLFDGTDEELINARIKICDIVDSDVNFSLFTQIQYCDFSKNYMVLIDYEKRPDYLPLSRLFDGGRLGVI